MDGFQILILLFFTAGIILVIVSVFFMFKKGGGPASSGTLEASLKEADEAAAELNKLAGAVMAEIDNKYQELLFLYNLIDEKKQGTYNVSSIEKNTAEPPRVQREKQKQKNTPNHPKVREIAAMSKEGVPVPEIAKKLGMGQGEVKLILELYQRQ